MHGIYTVHLGQPPFPGKVLKQCFASKRGFLRYQSSGKGLKSNIAKIT